MVPRAGVEPARPFSGKRRILSPQCLPISPSGRRLPNAHLRHSVTRAARTRNAPVLSGERNARSTGLSPSPRKKGSRSFPCISGAGKESRTLDLNLGKVALYQLSYSRIYRSFTLYNVCCDEVYCSAIFKGCQHFFINASTDRRWPHPQPIFLPPMPPRQPHLHHSKEPVCAPKQLPAPCRSI